MSDLTEPTPDPMLSYRTDYQQRGMALIINNVNFEGPGWHPLAAEDGPLMRNSLDRLGFTTTMETDCDARTIWTQMQQASTADHSNNDCFVCVILSHGRKGEVYSSEGEPITITTLTALFQGDQCPTLVGKPKIFIIQACRGVKLDPGVQLMSRDNSQNSSRIPAAADFLMAYSTPEDFITVVRDGGSAYITTLCSCLDTYATRLEIVQLLTLVNHLMTTYEIQNCDPAANGCKQIPSIVSQLTKLLYFPLKERVLPTGGEVTNDEL